MNILLVCSAGMSTSLLVNKMKAASKASNREDKIWAVGQSAVEEELQNCDVLLLGPQVRFLKSKIEPIAEAAGKPLDVIPPVMYGRVDGQAVLDLAIKLGS